MKPISRILRLIVMVLSFIALSSCLHRNTVVLKESHSNKKVVIEKKRHHTLIKTVESSSVSTKGKF